MLKRLIDLLIPSRCAACGARGEPCCTRCEGEWGAAREVVRAPTAGLVRVFALGRYRGVGRKLLIAYKERGRRDLALPLGRVLAEALVGLPLKPVVEVPGRPGEVSAGPGSVEARLVGAPARLGEVSVRPAGAPAGVDGVSAGPCGALAGPAKASAGQAGVSAGRGEAPARPDRAEPSGVQAGPLDARPRPATPTTRPRPPTRAICLVPAPSRPSAARVRGGQHVERLANAAAATLAARGVRVAVAPALELAGSARDAVGLGREQRVANLAGRLKFREAGRPPPGYDIVVLDDVVTTGATAAACARALAAAGFAVSAVLTLLTAG